jgi:hypothetical protein
MKIFKWLAILAVVILLWTWLGPDKKDPGPAESAATEEWSWSNMKTVKRKPAVEQDSPPPEATSASLTNNKPLQAQTDCPVFSMDGARCTVTPQCSGLIRVRPGSPSGLIYEWFPTADADRKVFKSIRYLDNDTGQMQDWDFGTMPANVGGWDFCPNQAIEMSYGLVVPSSPPADDVDSANSTTDSMNI